MPFCFDPFAVGLVMLPSWFAAPERVTGEAVFLFHDDPTGTGLTGTWWFWGIVLLVLVGMGAGGYWLWIRSIEARRKELENQVEERTHELSALLEVSQSVVSTLDLESLLDLILDRLSAVVDYNGAAIMIAENGVMRVLAYRGLVAQEEVLRLRFPLDEAPVYLQVVRRQEPVVVADVQGDTPLARAFREFAGERMDTIYRHIRCWMGIPLIVKEHIIGMLSIEHHEPGYYSPHQAQLVLAFADQAAVALENARLFARAEQRTKELEALYRADEELYRHLRLEDVLQALVDIAVDILQADKSSLMVWDDQREKLVVRVAHGFDPETMAQMTFAPGEGSVGRVGVTGEPAIVEDTYTEPHVATRITDPEGIRSFMHVPIKIGGQIFGVFNVDYVRPRAFRVDELRLFEALAQRAALAIETAQLHEQAQELAVMEERSRLARDLHDAVTQTLFSSSLIAEVLPHIWERDPDEGRERSQELRELTRGALAEMRTLLLELRPSALQEAQLDDLLRQLAESITGRARVPVAVDVADNCPLDQCLLPPKVKIAFYRIAQEALNNVAKHAGTCQAELSLRCQPGQVELCICDDGCGFDLTAVPPDHLGLSIMRERAANVGAALTIDSQTGRGTEVVVRWSDEGQTTKDER